MNGKHVEVSAFVEYSHMFGGMIEKLKFFSVDAMSLHWHQYNCN